METEPRILAEKPLRVLENEFVDRLGRVTTPAHFHRRLGDSEGVAAAPVAGTIQPNLFCAIDFIHVDGSRWSGF